jgi:hypothetical protein
VFVIAFQDTGRLLVQRLEFIRYIWGMNSNLMSKGITQALALSVRCTVEQSKMNRIGSLRINPRKYPREAQKVELFCHPLSMYLANGRWYGQPANRRSELVLLLAIIFNGNLVPTVEIVAKNVKSSFSSQLVCAWTDFAPRYLQICSL